jgi:hypothetical protein
MTNRSDLLERLRDLQELSTNKKNQLAKPEQEEVLSVLTALCTMDEDGYRVTVEALTAFPSEVGAVLLAENWVDLMDEKFPVPSDLRGAKFKTDLGIRLRIALAQRLLNLDPENALCLLLDTFQEMKPAKKPIPTVKNLRLIRSALIEPAGQSLDRLPLQSVTPSELTLLIKYVLAATFLHKKSQKPLPTQTQLAIIRWANGYPKQGQLPQDVENAIIQTVKTWDADFRSILAQQINLSQAALRNVLAPVCQTEATDTLPPEPQKAISPATPVLTVQAQPSTSPQEYDAMYEIGRIGKYVRSLESQLKKTRQAIQTAKDEWQQIRNELGVARREREEARRQAAVEHDSVMRLSVEMSALQNECESLQAEIEKLTRELDAARNHHDETVASHGEQLDTLSERIAGEGEHRVDAFRNKLGVMVQTYADGLKEATDMDMTLELGTALRSQMGQLLRLLKGEGIRINGGV